MSAPPLSVAVVTGAGGDIGRACVAVLRAARLDVIALDLLAPRGFSDPLILTRSCDVTDEADVARVVGEAVADRGQIDVLVTCAGVEGAVVPVEDYPLEEFRRVLDVNVLGTFLAAKHVLPVMRSRGSGSIVTIASTAGLRGSPLLCGYIASKHAVIGLTRALAAETAATGIRVNVVCPGPVEGRMISAIDHAVPLTQGQPSDRSSTRTPMGRYGRPHEVADAVRYLALQAPFVTGSVLTVDGGRTAV